MAKVPHEQSSDPETTSWSVEGIDERAKSAAREAARRQGVPLGQYLSSLLINHGSTASESASLLEAARGDSLSSSDVKEVVALAQELNAISVGIGKTNARAAEAIGGVDRILRGLVETIGQSGEAQLGALGRVKSELSKIQEAQAKLAARVDQIEATGRSSGLSDPGGPTNDEIVSAFVSEFRLLNAELDALHLKLESSATEQGGS